MSINSAKVSRTLVFKSYDHLWRLLKNKDEFWCSNTDIILFMYSVEKLINGCDCDKDKNIQSVLDYYEIVKSKSDCSELLKKMFDCQFIVFE